MSVREYVGARYVPLFSEPIEWDNNKTYEPLTIVMYMGNSYTSKQYVPVGIDINDDIYWAPTGNYNAQIEQYRQEVVNVQQDINAIKPQVATNAEKIATNAENIATNAENITTNAENIAANTKNIQKNAEDITTLEKNINTTKIVIIGDSWSDTREEATELTKWPDLLEDLMPCEIHNYSRNGAKVTGVADTVNLSNFNGQVEKAINDGDFNHDEIDFVIFFGGVNDYRSGISATTVSTNLINQINNMHTYFKNAKIITLLNWQILMDRNLWNYIQDVKNAVKTAGYPCYHTIAWFKATNILTDDYVHPNNNGFKELISNIIAVMFGGSPTFYKTYAHIGNISQMENTNIVIEEHFTEDTVVRSTQANVGAISGHVAGTATIQQNSGLISCIDFYSHNWAIHTASYSVNLPEFYMHGNNPTESFSHNQPTYGKVTCYNPGLSNVQFIGTSNILGDTQGA